MNGEQSFDLPCNGIYDSLGVDLNRNYGYQFNFDEVGSSSNPCDEQYRGLEPFSEPEVKAMRDFLTSHWDIKIVINLHSWGNLLITPYNFDKDWWNPNLLTDPYNIVYDDLHENAGLPEGNLFGSGI